MTKQAVQQARFAGVADGKAVRINNHKAGAVTRGLSARSPQDIVCAAMKAVAVGEEDYSLYEQNCEEFVTRMRYGEGWSSQVAQCGSVITRSIFSQILAKYIP